MGVFITGTMLAASFSLDEHARRRSLALVVPSAVFIWAAIWSTSDLALQIASILGVLAVSHQISRILLHALQIERVSIEKVQGSLAVFLLLGLNFALIYSILELVRSGSFALGDPPQHIPIHVTETGMSTHMLGFSHLLFHSYMTLCATSYGTVAAITPPALALTALETLIGQLYIAILVAQLMGLHLAFSGSSKSR
jgi:hypothetical protein